MPEPKSSDIAPPVSRSTSAGTNHELMPGPEAIASHTSSGVPGTSISRRIERVPGASSGCVVI